MTVTIYTQSSCSSSRKALKWLNENNIAYTEKRTTSQPLTLAEFKHILSMTEDGTDEIIATNSNDFKNLDIDIDQLSIQELYNLIQHHPRMLRSLFYLMKNAFKSAITKWTFVVSFHEKCEHLN